MVDGGKADFAAQIAAAIDWWREAGVDGDFRDEPAQWLTPETKPAPARPRTREAEGVAQQLRPDATRPDPPALPAIDRSRWPGDLAGFAAWWLSDPALDDGRTSGRVPPRGPAAAEYMVVVPQPERDDEDRLLSGPQGRLLDAMLAAMGIAPERTYVASVLPRHMPMPDWAALAAKGFGALLCHHVKLVRPQRLAALDGNILALLGHDPAQSPAVLREFNHEGLTIPLLAGRGLAALLERPRWKAGLWQGWLDWSEGQPGQG